MLVPAVMVVMSLVYALAAYLRGRAVRQRLRAQGYAAPLWTHGTAAIDRESWPRSAVVGGGVHWTGAVLLWGASTAYDLFARKDRSLLDCGGERALVGVRHTQVLALRAEKDD